MHPPQVAPAVTASRFFCTQRAAGARVPGCPGYGLMGAGEDAGDDRDADDGADRGYRVDPGVGGDLVAQLGPRVGDFHADASEADLELGPYFGEAGFDVGLGGEVAPA